MINDKLQVVAELMNSSILFDVDETGKITAHYPIGNGMFFLYTPTNIFPSYGMVLETEVLAVWEFDENGDVAPIWDANKK